MSNRINVTFSNELHAMIRQEAKDSGMTMPAIIRQAVWEYFQNKQANFINQEFENARLEDMENE